MSAMTPEQVAADRMFPILDSRRKWNEPKEYVPWSLVAPHERRAARNHYQTLERIAERGGLSWSELLAVLRDEPWRPVDKDVARSIVREILKSQEVKP